MAAGIGEVLPYAVAVALSLLSMIAVILMLFSDEQAIGALQQGHHSCRVTTHPEVVR